MQLAEVQIQRKKKRAADITVAVNLLTNKEGPGLDPRARHQTTAAPQEKLYTEQPTLRPTTAATDIYNLKLR